jgi:tRNA A37 threonylcarbamoyladenosine synthetase subunit TsaC/SUA5/YrdC
MFSIIAPSFERIEKNYNIADSDSPITNTQIHQYTNSSITINKLKEYLNTYHGVTYIFSYETPGVRIIKHPFQNFVQRLNEPFITTSCNIAGEPPLQDLKNISSDLKSQVDYIIDGGILGGRPSVLIDLIANKIIER